MNRAQDISTTISSASPKHTPSDRSGTNSPDEQQPNTTERLKGDNAHQTSHISSEKSPAVYPHEKLKPPREGMRDVTDAVIKEYKSFFKKHAKYQDKRNGVLGLLEKKLLQSTPARPFFTHSILQYLLKEKPDINKSLIEGYKFLLEGPMQYCMPLISEAVICVQYYDNHILDNKYNVYTNESIQLTRHKAYRLKKILYAYVDSRFSHLPEIKNKIKTEYLNRVFLFVDLGQKMELEFNHAHYLLKPKDKNIHIKDFVINYLNEIDSDKQVDLNEKEKLIRDNIKTGYEEFNYGDTFYCKEQTANELSEYAATISELSEVKKLLEVFQEDAWFLKLYFQRVSITSGFLYYSTVKFFLDLLNRNTQFEILQFARYFGVMRQVVNDNTDILPSQYNERSNTKTTTDALSDLRNGNITLPIYLLWVIYDKNASLSFLFSRSNKIFNNGMPSIDEKKLFMSFTQSYAIYISLAIGKELAAQASSYLKPDHLNDYTSYLDYMSKGLAGNNKFYRHFYHEEAYQAYKRLKKQVLSQLNELHKPEESCAMLQHLVNASKIQENMRVELRACLELAFHSIQANLPFSAHPLNKWKSLKKSDLLNTVFSNAPMSKIHVKNLLSPTILCKLACDGRSCDLSPGLKYKR